MRPVKTVVPFAASAVLAALAFVAVLCRAHAAAAPGSSTAALAPPPSTRPATEPATPPAARPETRPGTRPAGPWLEQLTLRPSPVTRPIAPYHLLPDPADQVPGDAVPLYLLARSYWPDEQTTRDILYPENKRYDYLGTPIAQFPTKYARQILEGYAETLKCADLAARRREAVWDLAWRERDPANGDQIVWRYLSDLHHVSNLSGFREQFHVSQRDWPAAAYALQTHFSMARHVGAAEPFLIHALMASIFDDTALRRGVTEWVSRGDSPNLYWALTEMPQPLVDPQPVATRERGLLGYWQPQLFHALRGDLPREQWPQVIREMVKLRAEAGRAGKLSPAEVEAEAKRLVESAVARARQYLSAHGTPEAQVSAMPPDDAVGSYLCREYQAAADELWKTWAFPFPEARVQMLRSWRALEPDKSPAVDNPLIRASLIGTDGEGRPMYNAPAVLHARYHLAHPDRALALLRTIEALRDYAARHDGRPPERLDQVTDLPVPLDPMTGEAFRYRSSGQSAVLDAPAPPEENVRTGWRYELTFAM